MKVKDGIDNTDEHRREPSSEAILGPSHLSPISLVQEQAGDGFHPS